MEVNSGASVEIPTAYADTLGGAWSSWSEPAGRAIEVADRVWMIGAPVVNVALIETDEGLVLIDCGCPPDGPGLLALVRSVTKAPLHTVIYTHGHLDHAFGLGAFLEEAGETKPRIVAHENVVERFHRYARTADYNSAANARQTAGPSACRPQGWWPRSDDEFFWPDTTYSDSLVLEIGGERFELNHAKGETDDATWVWVPQRRVACIGDLWIGGFPNAGNPQKVQRYPEEWAQALRQITEKQPLAVVPGHGMPLTGTDTVREQLENAARYLEWIVDYTVGALNAGQDHNTIVTGFRAPEDLAQLPYLRPVHDRPEFVVRNVIRRYGGWWNGRISELVPPTTADHARELVTLAGGADAYVHRARQIADENLPLACQLAEWAVLGDPDSIAAHRCFIDLIEKRLETETAFQARGILRTAANQSRAQLTELEG